MAMYGHLHTQIKSGTPRPQADKVPKWGDFYKNKVSERPVYLSLGPLVEIPGVRYYEIKQALSVNRREQAYIIIQ